MNPNDLRKKLLLANDNYGYMAWHRAAEGGNLESLETLWSWVMDLELNEGEFF